MKKKFSLLGLLMLLILGVTSCKKDKEKTDPNNPNNPSGPNTDTPLILSSQEVDKVFNPFFSTTGADSSVVGMTQIGMLGNDKEGNPTYGENEATVVLDYETETKGIKDVDQTTEYYFVLKNNIKFSNGSPLTMKDVLFNLYVYLDPVYSGSSTIYSTDIVGLQEYRTQEANEEEQKRFKEQFETAASTRITNLMESSNDIFEENKNGPTLSSEEFREKLAEFGDENLVTDYDKLLELFEEELNTDFTNSIDSADSIVITNKDKLTRKPFTTDVEAFLYNEGYITYNRNDDRIESALTNDYTQLKTWTKEQAIQTVFQDKIPNGIEEILTYYNAASALNEYLINKAMEEHFAGATREFPNISGITFANRTAPITVNGKTYPAPTYDENGAVANGSNEVLKIVINDVDPKAIWNFAFTVAPMYYYSSQEYIDKFDYVSNFGVEYSSETFMNNVVKNPSKIGVPVGAGAYQASKAAGGTDNVGGGDFYDKGVIYFESNPNYLLGEPKVKKLRYQVVAQNRMLDALYNKEIDFIEPNAKPETIAELEGKHDEGIRNKSITTSGYGYIGINAGKVPDLVVRQVIMHCIDVNEIVGYYGGDAKAIYRSMSLASWAYPEGATAYYPYIGGKIPEDLSVVNPDYKNYVNGLGKHAGDSLTESEQMEFIKEEIEDVGLYKKNGNGIYAKGSSTLKYTFTIAGEDQDHPAWDAMYHASEILNSAGFSINVTTDRNALTKLTTGDLTVWAAAWGSTIDPDMYQVYHIDSNATSVNNWGYPQIKKNTSGKYDTELRLLGDLSELIDLGRSTLDQTERAAIYSQALDIVMQMAVELPTYQRNDLFAYNANKIDETSLTPDSDLSPYKGLMSDIHKVTLKVS